MTAQQTRSHGGQKRQRATRLDPQQIIAGLRVENALLFKNDTQAALSPIRVMARMVQVVEQECRRLGLAEAAIRAGVVNRSIGDVNLRLVVERDGRHDYRELADDLGVALPGEVIGGRVASGERYRALRARMEELERDLLRQRWDLHMYDVAGIGNPLLREWIAEEQQREWGVPATAERVILSIGSTDGLDKALRGLKALRWTAPESAIIVPTPSFGVTQWQATSIGLRTITVRTTPEARYTMTADDLRATLAAHPEARGLYLIISNNPTAFSYSPAELRAIMAVLAEHPTVTLLADMAYTGTGPLAMERERVRAIAESPAMRQTILVWSLSKVYTMTGDRFGWLTIGDPDLAARIGLVWMNTIAALPAEWQLRFMATWELIRDHPTLRAKVSDLYRLRRRALARQLSAMNAGGDLFARVNLDDDGTVYNWSQMRPGLTVFDLFQNTGIAGVPGGAFGYDDDHVRLAVGILPVPGWEAVAESAGA